MTPTLLFLPTEPKPGQVYAIVPILGDSQPRTAVCQRMIERRRLVGDSGFVYFSEMWWFMDQETGEMFEREVEVSK